MCEDKCIEMHIDMRVGMCMGMCTDMCIDMRTDTCTDVCTNMYLCLHALLSPPSQRESAEHMQCEHRACLSVSAIGDGRAETHNGPRLEESRDRSTAVP